MMVDDGRCWLLLFDSCSQCGDEDQWRLISDDRLMLVHGGSAYFKMIDDH